MNKALSGSGRRLPPGACCNAVISSAAIFDPTGYCRGLLDASTVPSCITAMIDVGVSAPLRALARSMTSNASQTSRLATAGWSETARAFR